MRVKSTNTDGEGRAKGPSVLLAAALPTALFGLFTFIVMSAGMQGDAVLAGGEVDELLYNTREGMLLAGFVLYGVFAWRRRNALSGKMAKGCCALSAALYMCCALVIWAVPSGAPLVVAVMAMELLIGIVGGVVYEKVAMLAASRSAASPMASDAANAAPHPRIASMRILGLAVGFGGALAMVAQYLLQLQLQLSLDRWFVVLLAACFCLLMYLVNMASKESAEARRLPAGAQTGTTWRKHVFFLVAVVACLFALFPFYEVVIREMLNWAVFYGWYRLLSVVGYLAIGAAAFFGGRPMMSLVVAIAAILMAFVLAQAALLQVDVFTIGLFYALLGAVIAYGSIAFMSLAPHTECPALVASGVRVLDGIITIAGGATAFLGGWPVSAVLLAALVLIAAIVILMVRGGFFVPQTDFDLQETGRQAEGETTDEAEKPLMDGQRIAAIAKRYDLTRRETEVLGLVLRGLTVQQMADELVVTKSTVKFHVTNILKKTGAQTRQQMVEMLSGEEERSVEAFSRYRFT